MLHIEYAEGKELMNIKYVALRIYDPISDWSESALKSIVEEYGADILYTRVMEFNFYGKYSDPTFEPKVLTDTKDFNISNLPSVFGKNIIAGSTPAIFENGKRNYKYVDTLKSAVSKVPDPANAHADLILDWNEEGDYVDLRFKINTDYELNRIKGFAFQGIYKDNEPYYTREFEIYVAEEAEDLFLGKPVFKYSAKEYGTMKGVVYEFPEGKRPEGNYFCIRILKPWDAVDKTLETRSVRVSLLYVWVEEAEVTPGPTNLAENMPIEAFFSNNGTNTKVSDSNLTVSETYNLTDASDSTKATINTKSSSRDNLNIIYNLCGDMEIDKISLRLLNNSTAGFKKMKVYAASSMGEVNTDGALIWTYEPSGSGSLNPTRLLNSDRTIRYVRFSFTGTKDYITINTINIEGMDNQKNKTRDITASLDSTNIEVNRVNLKSGNSNMIEYDSTILAYLIDGDSESYLSFHEDIVGENEYEIIIKLGDLRTISQVQVDFTKFHEIHHPRTVKIYTAESEEQLYSRNESTGAELIAEFGEKDLEDSRVEKLFKPFLSRYIKVVLSDFKENESYKLPDGNYLMNGICSDIKIIGSKVRGMQTSEDDETLLTFADKKTGMNVSIDRIDINDVFTDIFSMKITSENATNWQMRSLEKEPYLKVIDKKIYKIEFIDIYGNPVTNLGGRNVIITYTPDKKYAVNDCMIGSVKNKKKIQVLETVYSSSNATSNGFVWKTNDDNYVVFLAMTTADDKYWDSIGKLEDFSETDNNSNVVETHDAEWYKVIRTDDGLFEVAGIDSEIDAGVKFTATDISDSASDEEYEKVLMVSDGKKVAAFFNMNLTLDGEDYDYPGVVNIKINLPEYITDNYTDLMVVHISDDSDTIYIPWCETVGTALNFQTDSFSHFAIVGTALDGSTSIDDGSGVNNPGTGETANTVAATVLIMTAAAFVVMSILTLKKTSK